MILNFKLKSYRCRYKDGPKSIGGVCFSSGCGNDLYEERNRLYANVTIRWTKGNEELNYCFLDTETMIKYFIDLSVLLGFKLLSFNSNSDCYKLQIRIIPNRRYFIYVSTFIRYVYEFPFSLLTYCALHNIKSFPGLNSIQIIQLYIALFYSKAGALCHCHGKANYAYTNMNSKLMFSLNRKNFNNSSYLTFVHTDHSGLIQLFNILNTKNLPQIADGINNLANKYYVENEESIRRW